jgi:hypothetical protein
VWLVGLRVPRLVTSCSRAWEGKLTMTKADLVEGISIQTGVSKNHTAIIVDGMLDADNDYRPRIYP